MKGTTSFILISYVIRNQSLSSNYRDDFRDEIERNAGDKGWGLILEQRHSGTSDMTFITQVPIGNDSNEKLLFSNTVQMQIYQLLWSFKTTWCYKFSESKKRNDVST